MKFFKKMAAVAAAAAVATISLAGMSSMTTSAAGDIGIAELKGQMGTYQYWGASKNNAVGDIKSTPAVISGDGQYTTTLTLGGDGTGTIEFLILELDANSENYITQDTYPDMKIEINSIKADGVEQNFTADADGGIDYKYYEDTGKTRVYLCNTWSNVNGGKSLGLSSTTPVTQSIDVTFTISGIEAGGGTATTDPASTTEAPQNTDPNGTTADPNKTTTAGETTTTAAGGNGGSSNGGNNSSNGGSSNSSNNSSSGGSSSSNSSKSGTNNAKTSQTGDFGIAAVALGAVATAALGVGAYTITRKKK